MTAVIDRTTARDIRTASPALSLGFVVGCLAIAGLVVAVCYFSTQGLSPRIANPHPWRRVVPWMGFEYWPEFFQSISVVLCATLWASFIRLSIARGRMHPLFLLMVGVAAMTLLDPVATWAVMNVPHPRLWHFPDTWMWFNIQPLAQPIYMFAATSWYFLAAVLAGRGVYRELAKRAAVNSVLHRRPLLALAVVVYFTSVVIDFLFETSVGKSGALIYSQVIGSLSLWPGTYYQFPLYSPFMASTTMVLLAALAWEDANGRVFVERQVEKWRPSGLAAVFGKLALTSVIVTVGYFVVGILPYVALRESHLATTIARPWPFDNAAVYDPDGLYRRAGEPGPYVTDEWAEPPKASQAAP